MTLNNSAQGGWIGGTDLTGKIIQRIDSATTTRLYELPDIQDFELHSDGKVAFESENYAFDVGLFEFGAQTVSFLNDPTNSIFRLSITEPYAKVTDLFGSEGNWTFSDFDLNLSGPADFSEPIFSSNDTLSLLGFEIAAPQINLVRTGNTLGLHLSGEMGFAGTTFTVEGDIDSSGQADLTMALKEDAPTPSLGGFPLNAEAVCTLQISPPVAPATLPTAQVHVTGEMGFAGATFNLDGYITSSGEANLTMALIGNDVPSLGGFEASGSFALIVGGGEAHVHFDGAIQNVPGVVDSLAFAGDVQSNGSFNFTTTANNLLIAPNGTDAINSVWVDVNGTITLSREQGGPASMRIAGASAKIMLKSSPTTEVAIYSFSIDQLEIGSDGSFEFSQEDVTFDTDPFGLVAGESVFSFSANKVKVIHNPAGDTFSLAIESPSVTVANVFGDEDWTRSGDNFLTINLNEGADFELALWDGSDDLSFGGFKLTGTDVWLIREDNVMKLSLRQQDGMLVPPPSQLELPFNLGSFEIDTFEIASNGMFDLEILNPQIGPTVLHVSAEKMRFRNTTGDFNGLELFVENPQLHLPLGAPFNFPDDFSFNNQGFASFDLNNLAPEVLDFFGAFAPKADQQSMMDFKLATSGSGWEFYLEGDTGPRLEQPYGNGYAELKEFRIDSAGTITGTVRADLTVTASGLDYTLAQGDFEFDYDGDILKMSVPSLSTNLGFVIADMSGWIKSDASYSLSHSSNIGITQTVSLLNSSEWEFVRIKGSLEDTLSSDPVNGFDVKVKDAMLQYKWDGNWYNLPGLQPADVEVEKIGIGKLGEVWFQFPPLP